MNKRNQAEVKGVQVPSVGSRRYPAVKRPRSNRTARDGSPTPSMSMEAQGEPGRSAGASTAVGDFGNSGSAALVVKTIECRPHRARRAIEQVPTVSWFEVKRCGTARLRERGVIESDTP